MLPWSGTHLLGELTCKNAESMHQVLDVEMEEQHIFSSEVPAGPWNSKEVEEAKAQLLEIVQRNVQPTRAFHEIEPMQVSRQITSDAMDFLGTAPLTEGHKLFVNTVILAVNGQAGARLSLWAPQDLDLSIRW